MAETPNSGVVLTEVGSLPAFEGNDCKVLGKIDLPKPEEQAAVVWFSCTFPNCWGRDFREEEAILPNLKVIGVKLGQDNVSPEDLEGFVLCRYHANLLEDKGVRCYRYLGTLAFLERQAEEVKGLGAFLAPRRQEVTPTPLKARVEIPRGRDFLSPAAHKPVGRRGKKWQGSDNKAHGWADRRD